jgi:hypothetical protein
MKSRVSIFSYAAFFMYMHYKDYYVQGFHVKTPQNPDGHVFDSLI